LFDCGGNLDVINCSSVKIENSTFNDSTSDLGGGIYLSGSPSQLIGLTVNGNFSTNQGGGIYAYNQSLEITHSTIANNKANYGGGVYIANASSETNLINSKVEGNVTTSGSGGGVYAYGTLTISGDTTEIRNNTAQTYGGGVMIKTKGTILSGNISGNQTVGYAGGGVQVDGILVMNGGTITNNIANTNGGGVSYSSGVFKLISVIVSHNTARELGNDTYPDISDDHNIDWTKDESLHLSEIKVNCQKTFLRGKDVSDASLQGMTTTNDFIIFAQVLSDEDNTFLTILDKNTFALLAVIDDYCFGHTNDITYNPNTDEIYLLSSPKTLTKFKVNHQYELEDMTTVNLARNYSAIAYDVDHDYWIGYGSQNMYIMNNHFEEISSFSTPTHLTTQGITYEKDHIYFSCTENGQANQYQTIYNSNEKSSNLIYVYDMTGKLTTTLYIPNTSLYGEIESLSFLDQRKLIIGYNITLNGNKTVSFYTSDFLSTIQKIQIDQMPTKMSYPQYSDKLDLTGGLLTVFYPDGATDHISMENEKVKVTGFDSTKIGTNKITLAYESQTVSFDIKIKETYLPPNDNTTNDNHTNSTGNMTTNETNNGTSNVASNVISNDVGSTIENVTQPANDTMAQGKLPYAGRNYMFFVFLFVFCVGIFCFVFYLYHRNEEL
jgi:hypothetical protein